MWLLYAAPLPKAWLRLRQSGVASTISSRPPTLPFKIHTPLAPRTGGDAPRPRFVLGGGGCAALGLALTLVWRANLGKTSRIAASRWSGNAHRLPARSKMGQPFSCNGLINRRLRG